MKYILQGSGDPPTPSQNEMYGSMQCLKVNSIPTIKTFPYFCIEKNVFFSLKAASPAKVWKLYKLFPGERNNFFCGIAFLIKEKISGT